MRPILMRPICFCLVGLMTAASNDAFAQMKLSPKAAPAANEVRYFTAIDGLMDGNADVILKENRQGKIVTSAVLDVCYPAQKGSDRKDRFIANLAANGQTLSGTAQSLGDKLPVTVKLVRKPTGDTFEFRGQIGIGPVITEVASADNSDLSETEFQDNQASDDGITPAPKDFSEVSPESIGVKVKLEAVQDFVKALKGQDAEVTLISLAQSCDALRAGAQTINITADPERAAGLIAKFKASPGVISAGWTSGIMDVDRSIRFAAADWRDGDHINKDKLSTAVANVLSRTLAAKLVSSIWNASTGKLKLTFKRPSPVLPALELTEVVEVTALVSPEKPGSSDQLMLWISSPVISTEDDAAGPKLHLADEGSSDEEGEPKDDNGSVQALAKEFKGQRWDSDKAAWK